MITFPVVSTFFPDLSSIDTLYSSPTFISPISLSDTLISSESSEVFDITIGGFKPNVGFPTVAFKLVTYPSKGAFKV